MKKHMDSMESVSVFCDSLESSIKDALDSIDADPSIDDAKIEDICALYMKLVALNDDLRQIVSRSYKTLESFKSHRVLDKLDAMGADKVSIPSLGRSFYPKTRHSATMLDKEGGMAWLRENGAADLIKPSVHAQTLTTYIKSMITEDGVEPPPDLFKFSSHRYLGFSKYTPK